MTHASRLLLLSSFVFAGGCFTAGVPLDAACGEPCADGFLCADDGVCRRLCVANDACGQGEICRGVCVTGEEEARSLAIIGPPNAFAGDCVVLELRLLNEGGARVPASGAVAITVTANSDDLFVGAGCSAQGEPEVTVVVAAGGEDAQASVRWNQAGVLHLVATAEGLSAAEVDVTFIAGPAVGLTLTGPSAGNEGTCLGPFSSGLVDAFGNAAAPGGPLTVDLTTTGDGFFSALPSCANAIDAIVLGASTPASGWYYAANTLGSHDLDSSADGVAGAGITVTIDVPRPRQLRLSGPATAPRHSCVGPFLVEALDDLGRQVGPLAPEGLGVTSNGAASFFPNSGCDTPTAAFALATGAATLEVFAVFTALGEDAIVLTSDNLGVAIHDVEIGVGPATTLVLEAPDSADLDGCASVQLTTVDLGGALTAVAASTPISISAPEGEVFASSDCSGSPVAALDVSGGTSETTFGYRPLLPGPQAIEASAAGLASAEHALFVAYPQPTFVDVDRFFVQTGDVVVVSGTELFADLEVAVAGVPCATLTVDSEVIATCTLGGPLPTGLADVTLAYPGGTAATGVGVLLVTAPGLLDVTFSTDGVEEVVPRSGSFLKTSSGIVAQADGKIVVSGCYGEIAGSSAMDLVLARFGASGGLDTTFDGNGTLLLDTSDNDRTTEESDSIQTEACGEVALSGTDLVVVGGTNRSDARAAFAYKVDASGTPVSGFGTAGLATYPIFVTSHAHAITVLGSQLLIGGWRFLARVSATTGAGDTTFDDDGVFAPSPSAMAMFSITGGDVIATGVCSGPALCAYRFDDATDDLDDSWGSSGIANTGIAGTGNDGARRTNGTILVAGVSGTDMAVAQIASTGDNLDTSFGTAGSVLVGDTLLPGVGSCRADALLLQADGAVVLGGVCGSTPTIVRLTSSGALDTTFGDGGKVLLNELTGADSLGDMALYPDDRLVIVAHDASGSHGYWVARLWL